ncbi:hypothetical protein BH24CHL6_BH24CHL6_01370 [soil metagenome]
MERYGTARAEEPIQLVLVDEHPLIRAGVRTLLETDWGIEVLAETGSIDALTYCRQRRPDVLLMDLDLPTPGLLQGVQRLRRECSGCAVVILVHHDDDEQLFRSVMAGANGHVASGAGAQVLALTIRRAAGGEEPIGEILAGRPSVSRRVLEAYRRLAVHAPSRRNEDEAVPLSVRQIAILRYAAEGLTNRQIARAMSLSEHTIKSEMIGQPGRAVPEAPHRGGRPRPASRVDQPARSRWRRGAPGQVGTPGPSRDFAQTPRRDVVDEAVDRHLPDPRVTTNARHLGADVSVDIGKGAEGELVAWARFAIKLADEFVLGQAVQAAARVTHDGHFPRAQHALAEHQRADEVVAGYRTGVAHDVRVARAEPENLLDHYASVHAGQDDHPRQRCRAQRLAIELLSVAFGRVQQPDELGRRFLLAAHVLERQRLSARDSSCAGRRPAGRSDSATRPR